MRQHSYRKKIKTILTVIIIVVCCLVIIIIEYIKYNNSIDDFKLQKENILRRINPKLPSLETLNRNGKYILFFDHYSNIYINSNDAYPIFDYYRRKGRNEAYYFLLKDSQLYYKLKKENNLDNIIIVDLNKKNQKPFREMILRFVLNSKLIVYTYKNSYLNKIIKRSNYTLKAIYLDHGCPYFKETMFTTYLKKTSVKRAIVKIKPEFDSWIKHGWNENQLYKGALARWERFNHIENKKNAILIFFTWRSIKRINFFSSIFYKKINELFSNENFINYLISKKIKIFYKKHHSELAITRGYHNNNYTYIYEINDKDNFSKIIDDSSLLITDYSALSIDFMFQNKPVIFYLLDINDQNRSNKDKYNTKNITKKMIFGNSFNNSNEVIEKTKYYIENNFTLENDLLKKYESLFYYKKNILNKLENIFDQIIEEK